MNLRIAPAEGKVGLGVPGWVRFLVWGTGVLTVVYGVSVLPGLRNGPSPFWEVWVTSAVYVGASAVCVSRAVLVRQDRLAWTAMAGALALSSASSIGYAFAFPGPYYPWISFADVGWLASYPLTYVAIILLVRARWHGFESAPCSTG